MKKLIILACIILVASVVHAQIPTTKVLVADETWIVASGKTSFRLISSNDSISMMIYNKFFPYMTRQSSFRKKDRWGTYWERSYYFPNDRWNLIVMWINNGLR